MSTIERGYRRSARLAPAVSTLRGIGATMRPRQWYKQVVCYIAVVFSGSALQPAAWVDVTVGAALFSAVAGAVYIGNDISDIEEDRQHPQKRHRPIPSGQVSVPVAAVAALGLLAVAIPAAAAVEPLLAVILLAYVGQNVAYSTVLKEIPLVDVTSIGVGFVLRALVGVVLLGSPVSPWLVACTFLAAVMLGLGKRWSELRSYEDPTASRPGLAGYSPRLLRWLFAGVATTLLATYALYTALAGPVALLVTIPCACYAVLRFSRLVVAGAIEQPHELFADRPSLATFAVWGAVTLTILYALPTVA